MHRPPLDPSYNHMVEEMCKLFCGERWCTAPGDSAPVTTATLYAVMRYTRYVVVSSEFSAKTIFGSENARTNHMFRAWHDMVHVMLDAPMTLAGESLVAKEQIRQVRHIYGITEQTDQWCRILWGEIVAQAEYASNNSGEFVDDQDNFMRAWLAANSNLEV